METQYAVIREQDGKYSPMQMADIRNKHDLVEHNIPKCVAKRMCEGHNTRSSQDEKK